MSLDYGEAVLNPFKGSVIENPERQKTYDFDYLPDDENTNEPISDDQPYDDIIDLSDSLDI